MNEPRMNPSLSGFPRAFAHPAYWVALATLLLNDHVLKGSGLLPAVLTGKLSDFAGLIVAPVLACAAFGVRSHAVRAAWLALIALGFSAIKLSPMLAVAAGAVLTALGVRSYIWCDPTDLIALSVLPITWRLARQVAAQRAAADPLWPRRAAVTEARSP